VALAAVSFLLPHRADCIIHKMRGDIVGYETADVGAVLDGDLDGFVSAFLRLRGREQQEARLASD
jgi:hypothetical protein